jgi:hypothetical protein
MVKNSTNINNIVGKGNKTLGFVQEELTGLYTNSKSRSLHLHGSVLKTKKMKILLISDARFMTVTYLLQCNPQLLVKNSFL